MVDLSKSIRMSTAHKGITRAQLASEIGVHSPQISIWAKKGNIQLSSLERMAKALNMKCSELIALGEE